MAATDVTPDELRPLLFSLAYRMVGSVVEAEDLVQEAFLRFHRAEGVESPKAFLTTVVTRLAIDHLRSARVRREAYVGPWLPEPLVSAPGAEDRVERDETLSLAFLTLLERLTPVERAVYVLHELFGYGHDEIAAIVEKSVANCRQILTRARRHVDAGRPRFEPSRERREARFLAAVRLGDLDGLVGLLAADAVHYADGGGKAQATRVPIYGAEKIARLWANIGMRPLEYEPRVVNVNGQPGVAAVAPDGSVITVLTLDVVDDRVQTVWAVVNPDKLARVATALPPSPPGLPPCWARTAARVLRPCQASAPG
jgi:RNA polymerase sigma-70 factor, ECF subfamily